MGRGWGRVGSVFLVITVAVISLTHFAFVLCGSGEKDCFNVLDLRECKAFKGYRNR